MLLTFIHQSTKSCFSSLLWLNPSWILSYHRRIVKYWVITCEVNKRQNFMNFKQVLSLRPPFSLPSTPFPPKVIWSLDQVLSSSLLPFLDAILLEFFGSIYYGSSTSTSRRNLKTASYQRSIKYSISIQILSSSHTEFDQSSSCLLLICV